MNSDSRYALLITASPFSCLLTNTSSWLKPKLLAEYQLLAGNCLLLPRNETTWQWTVERQSRGPGLPGATGNCVPSHQPREGLGQLSGLFSSVQLAVGCSALPVVAPGQHTRARVGSVASHVPPLAGGPWSQSQPLEERRFIIPEFVGSAL